jgi:hypothetical protein
MKVRDITQINNWILKLQFAKLNVNGRKTRNKNTTINQQHVKIKTQHLSWAFRNILWCLKQMSKTTAFELCNRMLHQSCFHRQKFQVKTTHICGIQNDGFKNKIFSSKKLKLFQNNKNVIWNRLMFRLSSVLILIFCNLLVQIYWNCNCVQKVKIQSKYY